MSQKGTKHSTGHKYTTSQEMEQTCGNVDKSSQAKMKRHSKSATSVDSLETAGAVEDIKIIFSKFANMLREKATVDTAQRKELESLLQEARNHESLLKEKKNQLKKTLVQISEQL
ncbi:uncharacterized protein tex12 isoform 2-T2 [Syngnathus typhle]